MTFSDSKIFNKSDASRGLSATAQLLVIIQFTSYSLINFKKDQVIQPANQIYL